MDVPGWIRRMESGEAELLLLELADEAATATVRGAARELEGNMAPLFFLLNGRAHFEVGLESPPLGRLAVLAAGGRALQLLGGLVAGGGGENSPGNLLEEAGVAD